MTTFEAAKLVHVTCAALSIVGFIARFPLALRGSPLIRRRWVRIAPHVNDSALLAAAIVMLVLIQIDPLKPAWLQIKIAALGVYIVLGIAALRPTLGLELRIGAFVGAVLTFGYIVSVALTRSALGPLTLLAR
jgi:uncharacterized membrane protein SirB2